MKRVTPEEFKKLPEGTIYSCDANVVNYESPSPIQIKGYTYHQDKKFYAHVPHFLKINDDSYSEGDCIFDDYTDCFEQNHYLVYEKEDLELLIDRLRDGLHVLTKETE